MFWKRFIRSREEGDQESHGEQWAGEAGGKETSSASALAGVEVEAGAARPATILRVAGELEERGVEILELFKEMESPAGRAVFPLHLRLGDPETFVEVETEEWGPERVEEVQHMAAVLRSSEHRRAGFEVLAAYSPPSEVRYFLEKSSGALLQLDLSALGESEAERRAEGFAGVAGEHWGVELDYTLESLPIVEELLLSILTEEGGATVPILRSFPLYCGCYLGEVIRRNMSISGQWIGEGEPRLELGEYEADPVGKARAFMQEGEEDSISYYARYVIDELEGQA